MRDAVLEGVRRTVEGEVIASGAPEASIEELYRFPACVNDPDESRWVLDVLGEELGEEQVSVAPPLSGSEDFGLLAASIGVPSVFWFFGGYPREIVEGDGPIYGNHSPHFAPMIQPTLDSGLRAALAVVLARLKR